MMGWMDEMKNGSWEGFDNTTEKLHGQQELDHTEFRPAADYT